jgi:hypothetical protein
MRGYTLEDGVIVLHRTLTELDRFVQEFLKILIQHTDYLVVSGYVSIATGRTRGTEDVDILVPRQGREAFRRLFQDLREHGFWCLQGESDVYGYIDKLHSVRFARKDELFPNIELIPFVGGTKEYEFRRPQRLRFDGCELKIPPLEFEILYKEVALGSAKDMDDARHLRTLFKGILRKERFAEFEKVIRGAH